MEHQLLLSDGRIITRGHGALQKKRLSSSCSDEIASAKSVEAYVVRLCTEFHLYPRVEDCAKRCLTAQRGQNSCAAAHARSLEGTLLVTINLRKRWIRVVTNVYFLCIRQLTFKPGGSVYDKSTH